MKIVCFSDTHCRHELVKKINCDVVIFSGDCCSYGKIIEFKNFIDWYATYPATYKLFVAGNHDRCIEYDFFDHSIFSDANVIHLFNSGVEIQSINFYGTPYQPYFNNWAFNIKFPSDLKEIYDDIPNYTDILITHNPPFGHLDYYKTNLGSEILLETIKRVEPNYHIFGHIHESYGVKEIHNGPIYVNCSVVDGFYKCINSPCIINI